MWRERERAPWSESVKEQSAKPDVVLLSSDDDFTPSQVLLNFPQPYVQAYRSDQGDRARDVHLGVGALHRYL